jgi:hypothetical protein
MTLQPLNSIMRLPQHAVLPWPFCRGYRTRST